LIVEDDINIAALLAEVLRSESEDYQVTAAIDGVAALQLLDVMLVDLIITDLQMPRLDGIGLYAALQNNPITRLIPVLFITATPDDRRLLEHGVSERVLAKPFAIGELLDQVAAIIYSTNTPGLVE